MKPLVPHFIQEQFLERQFHGTLQAYVMFVDLSGFTPLTETLMKKGSAGAEELSNILNDIFEPLVHLVYQREGFIPYFAGDAFTAIFPDHGEQTAGLFLDAALATSDFFRQRDFNFGGFTIGLKIGLSYGDVEWGIVGHHFRSFYFRGQPVDQSALCQDKAKAQHYGIVVDEALRMQLPEEDHSFRQIEPGFYCFDPKAPKLKPILTEPQFPALRRDVAELFLPEEIVAYQQQGEFRTVISVFIAFDGAENRRILNRFAAVVIDQINTFSGYFKEIDFGDKGAVIACFFGAPVTFENIDDRALEFIYSLKQELSELQETFGLRFKVGATQGLAYTGFVGGVERCQYAVVGNQVNLAARLMAGAEWGEILVDGEIHRNRHFIFQHHGDIKYKGIRGSIPTFRLEGKNEGFFQTYTGALVGRDEELRQLIGFAKPLLTNKPAGIAFVYGEAGIGKSRLSHELRKALTDDNQAHWAFCPADQILKKPFNPFVYFLKNYFGQSPDDNSARNLDRFENRYELLVDRLSMSAIPDARLLRDELIRTKSVLAALVGIMYLDSLWEQLDARGRYQNTIQAVVNLFCCEAAIQPLVIEVEDAHWLDESSHELLNELLRQVRRFPILLLVTSRFNDDGTLPQHIDPAIIRSFQIPVLEIELHALPGEAVRQFAETRLAGSISAEFLTLLLRTTNSNPFYLEQLLEYFSEQGFLEKSDGNWTVKDESIQLSSSINAILTARIDRLSNLVKETVKAAAVIGREFELPVLTEVMKTHEEFIRQNGNPPAVLAEQVHVAEQVQIWRAMTELRYIFRHSLLREAAYSMQLRTRLQQLHRSIADAIERLYSDNLEDRYVDLAFHYEQAELSEKTCEYLLKAADYARRNFQNLQALEYYRKLIQKFNQQTSIADRIEILLKKGRVLEIIGHWEECYKVYQEALELANDFSDKQLRAATNNNLGRLLMLRGDYFGANRYLQNAVKLYQSTGNQEGIAEVFGNLGNLYFRRGQYEEAEKYFEDSIEIARRIEGFPLDAQIVANLGLTHMNRGSYEEGIRYQQEQLELCRAHNDKQGMATMFTYLGIVFLEKGDYDSALSSFRQGLELSNELGNKQLTSIAIGNIGIVYERKGDYVRAMENYVKDLELCEELGDKQGTAIALGLIGQLLNIQGEFHKAIEYLQKDLMLCEELGYQKGIAKALNTLGDIFFNLQQFQRSLHFYNRAIEVTRAINNKLVLGFSLVEKGTVLLELSDWVELEKVVGEALEVATELGNPDLGFEARLLSAKVYFARQDQSTAKEILYNLLGLNLSPDQEAAVYYEFYRLNPADTTSRDKAFQLYQQLFKITPRYLYKLRLGILERLTR